MGIKLNSGINAIAATCVDGIVKYVVGDEVKEFWVPGIDKYINVREPQCNHFKCPNAMALLKGDEYAMVLRYDGTGCIYVQDTKVLLKSFVYPAVNLPRGVEKSGGTYFETRNNKPSLNMLATLYTTDNENYIFTTDSPVSFVLKKAENLQYFKDLNLVRKEGYPGVRVINHELCAIDVNGGKIYALKGKLYDQPAFIIL